MELIAYIFALIILGLMWWYSFTLFKACWIPAKSSAKAISFVNAQNGRFFKLFRICSALLLPYFTLLLVGNIALLAVKAWSRFAS